MKNRFKTEEIQWILQQFLIISKKRFLPNFIYFSSMILSYQLLCIIGKKCQQYGHSCLGGHGKRNDESATGEFQKIANLLRQLIAQRIDLLQRNSPQVFDADVMLRDDFDANKLDKK